jgi:hypothetical protein
MSGHDPKHEEADESAGDEDREVLPEENKSILLGMIKQLKNGMDLSRVTLPTFVLEPRSFLERLTDFMLHPQPIVECTSLVSLLIPKTLRPEGPPSALHLHCPLVR